MERPSKPFCGVAGALIAVTFALSSSLSLEARAQDGEAAAPADAASTAEQPRSRRERRRAAEAAAEAEKAATAQAQAAAEPAVGALAETVIAAEEEELVCKMYKQTGTKIGRRVCGTQAEWDAWADRTSEEAKDVVREISSRSSFPAAPTVPTAVAVP